MPLDAFNAHLRRELDGLRAAGLYKAERRIETPQQPAITVGGREVVNFCANNYLGLANHPDVVAAALDGLKAWGYGLSSVRFICGTQDVHKRAERQIADFFGRATPSSTSPRSTPTAGCSSRCSGSRTPSSPTS